MSQYKKQIRYKEKTVEDVLKLPLIKEDLTDRGIRGEILQELGIRQEISIADGISPVAHYFPVTKKGKISGYIRVDLTIPKKSPKHFTTIGEVDISCDLLGKQQCKDSATTLVVTEGVYDWPSIYQVFKDFSRIRDKKSGEIINLMDRINITSIVLGTKNALDNMMENESFVRRHQKVITVFDNDKAVKKGDFKGREATSAVHLWLDPMPLENTWVPLGDDMDANDYLQRGDEKELYWCLKNSQPYEHSQLKEGCPVDYEELLIVPQKGLQIRDMPIFNSMLGGFRPHELSILLAPPKVGKTSLTTQWHHDLMADGIKCAGAYLEDTDVKVGQKFVALVCGMKLKDFRAAIREGMRIDQEKVLEAYELMKNSYFFSTKSKGITVKELPNLLEYAAKKGAQFIVLDHISKVISSSKDLGEGERRAIDTTLDDLESLVRRYPIHILAIAHVNKDLERLSRARRRVEDEETGEVLEPYWYEIMESDGRGSRSFEQLCHNMIGLDKQYMPDGGRGHSRLRILYNREEDNTGVCDELTLSEENGRLISV